jgi:mannose-1-phosphate guanylyltransferase/mannose-6-phosphate isomerase
VTEQRIVPIVIAGGAGTRLWPASREALPKQFIPLLGDASMFQTTLDRVAEGFAAPVVVTHADFRFLVERQMGARGMAGTILLEPARRDSAPAIAAAALAVERARPGALALVLPADHLVADVAGFSAAVARGRAAAEAGRIVTFGMRPDRPHTGYGYIAPGEELFPGVHAVARFLEKPDAVKAAALIAEGALWNAGMFLFRAADLLAELTRLEPAIVEAVAASLDGATTDLGFTRLDPAAFARAPRISVDYAVMERTGRAAVAPASFGWSDVGNWAAVWDASPQDAAGNVTAGDVELVDVRGSLVRTSGPLTVVVGVEDAVVLVENDAVLVARREGAESVKRAVERLKARGHDAVLASRRVDRPWGYYEQLDRGDRFQVKRIVVQPGGRLSLQSHVHRSEHWVVVRGTARVTRDGEDVLLRENESIYLPLGAVHRLANPGRIPLEIIEVQVGSYLGEDDIVRYEDQYNRV